MVKIYEIVQVTNREHRWFPALVVVTKIYDWGIQGYTHVPLSGDAYIRLKFEDFESTLGEAIVIPKDEG